MVGHPISVIIKLTPCLFFAWGVKYIMTSAVIVALMVILALLIAAVVLDVKQYDGIYWARMTEGMSNTARAIRTQITTPAPPKKLIGEGMTSIESIAFTDSHRKKVEL